MGHLDRDAARDECVEQCDGVFDRDIEAAGKRGGGDEWCRRYDVDRGGGARIASSIADGGPRREPFFFQKPQELGAGFRLLG
jgi:hypothetical protein